MTEPEQSLDFNMNDLGSFQCLKTRIRLNCFGTIDNPNDGVQSLFREHDLESLERVWQSIKEVRPGASIPGQGGNDLKVEHTTRIMRQRLSTLPKSVLMDREMFKKTLSIGGKTATNQDELGFLTKRNRKTKHGFKWEVIRKSATLISTDFLARV